MSLNFRQNFYKKTFLIATIVFYLIGSTSVFLRLMHKYPESCLWVIIATISNLMFNGLLVLLIYRYMCAQFKPQFAATMIIVNCLRVIWQILSLHDLDMTNPTTLLNALLILSGSIWILVGLMMRQDIRNRHHLRKEDCLPLLKSILDH
jgi:hypothetical protein